MPQWEVVDRETGSVLQTITDHTMREAQRGMLHWLQSIGAEEPATYGVKPKHIKAPEDQEVGDNKVQARAVLSGGKTLTGQTRDTLEIDPMMRKPLRPDQKEAGKKEINNK